MNQHSKSHHHQYSKSHQHSKQSRAETLLYLVTSYKTNPKNSLYSVYEDKNKAKRVANKLNELEKATNANPQIVWKVKSVAFNKRFTVL